MSLEAQLQASLDIIELRKRDSATLAAVIKAAQAELQARKAKLRSDVAELAKQKKLLQRQAAELSSAGYRVRARQTRKDKGSKRGPKLVATDDPALHNQLYIEAVEARRARRDALREEAEDEQRRDDYERQNAARGNEP